MIFKTSGDPIEVKWLCTHPCHELHEKCGPRAYHWRFADEMHGFWHGPFPSRTHALGNALQSLGLEVATESEEYELTTAMVEAGAAIVREYDREWIRLAEQVAMRVYHAMRVEKNEKRLIAAQGSKL